MLAVTRYRVDPAEAASFLAQGHVGRATDDPALWVLTSEWDDVGSYRRALSAHEVKITAVPLLSRAIDEPTAFEELTDPDGYGSALPRDAGQVRVGEAAAAVVLTDLD
jgi:hypothetical protein